MFIQTKQIIKNIQELHHKELRQDGTVVEDIQKNRYFSNAIKKYGWDNFEHEVLFTNLTKEDAEKKEIELIKDNNCKVPNGYNISDGGCINSGWKHTEEYKDKMSSIMKDRKLSNETRLKISNSKKGKPYKYTSDWHDKMKIILSERNKTEKMRKISSDTHKRENLTEYQLAEMSRRMTGSNHPLYGMVFEKNPNAKMCICDFVEKPICQKEMHLILNKNNINITNSRLSLFLNILDGKKRLEEQKELSYGKYIQLKNINLMRVGN